MRSRRRELKPATNRAAPRGSPRSRPRAPSRAARMKFRRASGRLPRRTDFAALLEEKNPGPELKRRQCVRLDESPHIFPRVPPIDGLNHPFDLFHAPRVVGRRSLPSPGPVLIKCRRKEGVVDAGSSPRIPDKIIPVPAFHVLATKQGMDFSGLETGEIESSDRRGKGKVEPRHRVRGARRRIGIDLQLDAKFPERAGGGR